MPTFQVWNKCNNRCVMCTNPDWLNSDELCVKHSFENKKKEILSIMKQKKEGEMIQFTGGEPTIHPEFFKLFYWVRQEFPLSWIYLITNGRMFFYEEFAKKVLKVEDLTIQLSLLGPNSEVHDKITNAPQSFLQTTTGVKNILKYKNAKQQLELRIVLTKLNISYLNDILKFVYDNFFEIDFLVIIFPEAEGRCKRNFEQVGLTYAQTREVVESIVPAWLNKFKDLRLYHFPLCQLDPSLWKYVYRTLPKEELTSVAACAQCSYKEHCLGIHRDYLDVVGEEEFKPIKEKVILKIGDDYNHPIIG